MRENLSPTLEEGSMTARVSPWEINSTPFTLKPRLYYQEKRDTHRRTPLTPRTSTYSSQTNNTKTTSATITFSKT